MKYLIFILLLFACGSKESPRPAYTSIQGDWQFSNPDTHGIFTIRNDSVVSGQFTVLGKTLNAEKLILYGDPDLVFAIELRNSEGYVNLELAQKNLTYDTIKSPQYSYGLTLGYRQLTSTLITR